MRNVIVMLNIIGLFLIVSCGDDGNNKETTSDEATKQSELKISSKAIENFNYDDYAPSSEARAILNTWEKYQELAIQIDYLKKADLAFFNSDKKLLVDFISELKANVPERLQTNPIISRVSIIETKLLKLNENLTISNIKTETKLQSIKEVLVAFSNLTLQINKKLEFDLYNSIEAE